MELVKPPLSAQEKSLRMRFPDIERWEQVRARIRARQKLLSDPARHDATDMANWADINSIFCRALAFGVYFMPKIYSDWPAHWHDFVLRKYDTGKWCRISGPRRRGKSSLFRLHQLYTMLTLRYTFSTHILLSPELELEHSGIVIDQLENNVRLQKAFNIHPGVVQREDHFEVKVGTSHRTTLKFEWMTRDGKPRGTGRHLVGADDIDDLDDSPYVMEKYFNSLHSGAMGALEPFEGSPAQFIISGNLVGHHCNMVLFETRDARQKPADWIVFNIPAIEKGQTQEITKTLVGHTTWPARFSTAETKATIERMNMSRLRSGDMELQNELADLGKMIWQRSMFEKRFKPESVEPHQRVSRVYVDTSQKTTEAGDDWGIVRVTKVLDGPHKGEYWIERVVMEQLDPDTAIDYSLDMAVGDGTPQRPQCRTVKCESKTDKGVDPWLNDLQKTARRDRSMLLSVGMIVATKDKRTRALRAVPVGTSNAIRTPEVWDPAMERLVEQMCTFTGEAGQHLHGVDDGHDAVVQGILDLLEVVSVEDDYAQHEEATVNVPRLPAFRTRHAA